MTVCIAALADNGKKLVIAADNMLTIGVGTTIQYQKEDTSHKKIIELNEQVYLLAAGRLDNLNPIIKQSKAETKPATTPEKCAEIVRKCYQDYVYQVTENEILAKSGFNWDYYRNKQLQINPEVVKDLHNKINNVNIGVDLIVAGYNQQTKECYIGVIGNPGFLLDKTLESFTTNGSGGDLAKFSLVLSDYNKSLPSDKVEVLVKKALQDAKKSPGVGDLGDLFIIPKEVQKLS